MKKKLYSTILVIVLILSCFSGYAFADSADIELSQYDYAYMDIATAPEELIATILEARNTIIFDQSWTVDGQCAMVCPDGTIEELLEFSELFPGWDIPVYNAQATKTANNITRAASFNGNVYITTPPSNTISTPFYTFTASSKSVDSYASSIPGSSYNLGYANSAGSSIGWATYMPAGYGLALLKPTSGAKYSVRASTYSTSGTARLTVYEF